MDIGFDRGSWTKEPADRAGGQSTQPEWHTLQARLSAARAARRVLSECPLAVRGACAGSFDGASARVLADYGQVIASVNPVFWANGKPVRNMERLVADPTNSGDRG